MQTCQTAIEAARSIKVCYSLNRRHLPEVILVAESHQVEQSLRHNKRLIEALVPCGRIQVSLASALASGDASDQEFDVTKWSKKVLPDFCLYLQLEGQVDVQREEQRISQRLAKLEATRVKLQTKLDKSEIPEDKTKWVSLFLSLKKLGLLLAS